jgi:type IV secretion system protein VirB6
VRIFVLALIIFFAQEKNGLSARRAGGIAFDAVRFRSMAQGIGNVVNPKTTRRDMQSGMMVTAFTRCISTGHRIRLRTGLLT